MKDYPRYNGPQDADSMLRYISKERKNDIRDFISLKDVFISGRKVDKIPTGSSDISTSDRVGDFNYDASYLYLCIDNSGAAWRRVSLSTW